MQDIEMLFDIMAPHGCIRIRRCPYNAKRFMGDRCRDKSLLRNIFGSAYFLEADYENVLEAMSHWGFSLEEVDYGCEL